VAVYTTTTIVTLVTTGSKHGVLLAIMVNATPFGGIHW
jgi:hypothetical protein